jgi:hypothetical protein
MNLYFLKYFRHDDSPECYNRARYIREACKVFPDLWKSDKDFVSSFIPIIKNNITCFS